MCRVLRLSCARQLPPPCRCIADTHMVVAETHMRMLGAPFLAPAAWSLVWCPWYPCMDICASLQRAKGTLPSQALQGDGLTPG